MVTPLTPYEREVRHSQERHASDERRIQEDRFAIPHRLGDGFDVLERVNLIVGHRDVSLADLHREASDAAIYDSYDLLRLEAHRIREYGRLLLLKAARMDALVTEMGKGRSTPRQITEVSDAAA